MSDKRILLGILLLALTLWIIGLGNLPLRDWDEGTYAMVAREIYRTGNWFYPTLQGDPFLLKPPLMQWLIAICYHLGGVGEFTTRFPGAFLTALGVPLLYLIGRLVFLKTLPALFSSLVYLTLLPVVRHGRLAMLDGIAISFFLLLLFCTLKARQHKKYALGIGLCLGLITLTKGMLVMVFIVIAGTFIIANKQLDLLKNPYFWIGIVLGNFPSLGWYVAQWQHYGDTFLKVHFQDQAFDRLGTAVEGNTGPIWYYLLEIIKYGFPWLLFLPEGLYLSWKNPSTSWGSLILIGGITYFSVVSLMSTKLPWYIMPIYPFLALAIGNNLSYIWEENQVKSKFFRTFFIFLSLVGLGGCIYFSLFDQQSSLIIMSVVLMISMLITSQLISQHNRQFIPILFGGMYLVLFFLMISKSWVWELNEKFPVQPVAALIRQHVPPGTKIYTSFPDARPSLDFYSDCQIIPTSLTDLSSRFYHQSYLLINNKQLVKINLKNSRLLGESQEFTLIAPI
ncbi:ArnT family glycosyltransferase [Cylindrospermopsis raciborskii]|uniref:Phospholipid carrier-dependent glycosyltransferase n=1 Tax=Cylindrospermopsis raciborskii CENA302 TaxID=1170768 RepID=A0A9Q5QZ70_9CYAN|nr:glycosyltransferase family 39 protein [Cylindrospermopsis raciborskii]OPH10770.1 phospholipid carrier-dependent glycosyltransferase [Cylindrospermopsis raciborskii CENA302]